MKSPFIYNAVIAEYASIRAADESFCVIEDVAVVRILLSIQEQIKG